MVQGNIFVLVLLSIFCVRAVEIYNDGRNSELSWWRRPVIKHPNIKQITPLSTTPAISKNEEFTTTVAPAHFELTKTNSDIEETQRTPELVEDPRSTPVSIDTITNLPTSTASPPINTSEEPVVKSKSRRPMFSFGSEEPSRLETKPGPGVISWIPENIVHSEQSATPPEPLVKIKAEESIHEKKLKHHIFSFESTNPSPANTELPKALHSVWVPETIAKSKPFLTSSVTPPTTVRTGEPILIKKPTHHIFNFGITQPSITESGLHITPSSETTTEYVRRATELITVTETPSSGKYVISTPSSILPDFENYFNATELSLVAQPTPIDITKEFIVYQYNEPRVNTDENYSTIQRTLLPRQIYRCEVKNGYYDFFGNCDKFFQCKNNVLKLYKCSNGLHFNRNVAFPEDPCDEPTKSKCGINKAKDEEVLENKHKPAKFSATLISSRINYMCPSRNGYYRLDNYCEKFIKCEEHVPSSYQCASELKFNSYAIWGQDPCSASVQCKTEIIRPTQPVLNISATFIKHLPIYSCPESDGYFSSENDCVHFVKCEKFRALLYKCESGLQFNRYASLIHDPCDKEAIVRCKAVAIFPEKEPKISATLITARLDYSCPAANGYYKVENDCEKFVKCENSDASSYKCNPGLQFNNYAQWGMDPCASSEIVRCKTIIFDDTPSPFVSAMIISKANFSCPAREGYYGTDIDCDHFYVCEKSIASLYKCSAGLQFNNFAKWGQNPCADEKVIRCEERINQPRPEPKISADLISRAVNYKCASSEGYFKIEDDCVKFIKCEKSVPSSYKCWLGLQFNSDAVWGDDPCTSESVIGCKAGNHESKGKLIPENEFSAALVSRIVYDFTCPENNGYFNSKNECEKFIKCENAVASLYKCLPGLQFNRDSVWGEDPCASESIVGCKEAVLDPVTVAPTKFSAKLVSGIVLDFTCPMNNGYFNSKNECEEFIRCENAMASLYKCLPGLQFNRNSVWGEDPCASESIVGCKEMVLDPTTVAPPKFSANVVSKFVFDFTCPKNNGYFNSKNECDEFIKCENAMPSLYKCLPGLQFNQKSVWGEDPCASESIVRCKEMVLNPTTVAPPKFSANLVSKIVFDFTCPKNNGYFNSKNECEEFIRCENAMASLYKCLPGLQFNQKSVWGDDPCASESIVRCKEIVPDPTMVPVPKYSANLVSSVVLDFTCPTNNGYFKSKNECEEFIKCENAMASLYKCLPGLQFNHTSAWGQDPCAPIEVVRCKPVVVFPPEPKFSADLISRYVWEYTCSTKNGYFALGTDCDKFVKCENFKSSSYKCWPGLQFNPQALMDQDPCATETVVGCKAVTIPPEPKQSAILISSWIKDYKCVEANGFFGIDDNCERFVKCKMFVPSLYMCQKGLQFNRLTQFDDDPCLSESVVRCEIKTSTTPTPKPALIPSYTLIMKQMFGYTCSAANGYFSIKEECGQFIECKNYIPSLYRCNSGLYFNRNVVWGGDPCALPSIAQCESSIKNPVGSSTESHDHDTFHCKQRYGIFPLDTFECHKYIMCENGKATVMPCPLGLVFNSDLRSCDWPVNVPSCNPEVFHGFTCPALEDDDDHIIKFKYEQSCSQYIACQHGHPRLLSCDKGLSFSEEAQACVSSERVTGCRN